MSLQEINNLSIEEYLQSQGFQIQPKSKYLCCKSPFSRDSNWSLVIYQQTNSFYDWSTGFGGSIIDLAMAMHALSFPQAVEHLQNGNLKPYQRNYKVTRPLVTKDFEYTRYLTTDVTEIEAIRSYAESRGLRNGFEYGFYFVHNDGNFIRKPSVMFIHRDSTNKITGVKFRDINPKDNGNRFSARGSLGFYILEYVDPSNYGDTVLSVVEGESNANSLWQYYQDIRKNCVIISFGGVGNLPTTLPSKYDNISDRRLIIDYDGDPELYSKRLEKYKHYDLKPITLLLPKGEDINSLYCKKQMNLIKGKIL
jgi:hypothetical protein